MGPGAPAARGRQLRPCSPAGAGQRLALAHEQGDVCSVRMRSAAGTGRSDPLRERCAAGCSCAVRGFGLPAHGSEHHATHLWLSMLLQWDDPNYGDTRIEFDKAEFVKRIHEHFKASGNKLADGYAPFCKVSDKHTQEGVEQAPSPLFATTIIRTRQLCM